MNSSNAGDIHSIHAVINNDILNKELHKEELCKFLKVAKSFNFDQMYNIFNKIAEENDVETMSFAINEKLHEIKNKHGQDIFSCSLEISNFNVNRFMIESGFDYTQHLLTIYTKLNPESAKYFFKIQHFDITTINKYNEKALICASANGHLEVVKLLLTIPEIDINAKDKYNRTALIWASDNGHYEVVKLFLAIPGIDVNAKDNENWTALILASMNGHHEVVKLFLTVPGIDVNAKNIWNETALMRASFKGYHEIVKLLLTVPGIDINVKDYYNKTVLIWASKESHHEVVKLLLTMPGIDTTV